MPTRLIQQHDRFFKWVIDQPDVADALIALALPPAVQRLRAPAPAEPLALPPTLVSKDLEELRTDRWFRCPVAPDGPADLLVLVEHKARPHRGTPWQLADYLHEMVRAWRRDRDKLPAGQRHRLPVAVAVLVYHGRLPWTVPLSLAGMATADETIWPYTPNVRMLLIDVQRLPVAALPPLPRLRAAVLIWQFDRRSSADPKQHLIALARTSLALSLDDLIAMIYYLAGEFGQDGGPVLRDVLAAVVPGRAEAIMQTMGEKWLAEGRAKGLIEGRTEGRTEGRAEGRTEGRAEILQRLLRRRFGDVPASILDRLTAADIDQLDAWSDRFVDAKSLDDIFGSPRGH